MADDRAFRSLPLLLPYGVANGVRKSLLKLKKTIQVCDRCCEEHARVTLNLPTYGQKHLGENCLNRLVEIGLKVNSLVIQGDSIDAFLKRVEIRKDDINSTPL